MEKKIRGLGSKAAETGKKERDAIKIDAVLKAMKISGNTTLVSEVQNESRRFFSESQQGIR